MVYFESNSRICELRSECLFYCRGTKLSNLTSRRKNFKIGMREVYFEDIQSKMGIVIRLSKIFWSLDYDLFQDEHSESLSCLWWLGWRMCWPVNLMTMIIYQLSETGGSIKVSIIWYIVIINRLWRRYMWLTSFKFLTGKSHA